MPVGDVEASLYGPRSNLVLNLHADPAHFITIYYMVVVDDGGAIEEKFQAFVKSGQVADICTKRGLQTIG